MIVFQGVSFEYPGSGRRAIDDVSLTVSPGERVAVIGSNGSGKSTLGLLCNGLLTPTRGSVLVDGHVTSDPEDVWRVREAVGMVFQDPDDQIVGTVVEDDVAFGPENLGVPREELRRRVDDALAAVGLTGLEHREPHLLSGGQKQRVAIAGALALHPRYLVLDEPTAMLDAVARAAVRGVIDALVGSGTGVVHITHDLAEAWGADRILALDSGSVVFEGEPAALAQDAGFLASIGVESPPLTALARELRELGMEIPLTVRDASELVDALWP